VVYQNPFVTAHEDILSTPRGGRIANLRLVSPSFACVVPVTVDGKIVFVQNYRPALNASLLELPGGRLEPNEAPRHAAGRELEEETGYRAGELTPLGWYYPSPHRSVSRGHLFLGRKLREGTRHPDATEELRTLEIPVALAYRRLREGRLHDSSTVIGLSLAEPLLRAREKTSRSKRLIPRVDRSARSGVG
jgi:ADP-ribose pyrophosphatase